MDTICGARYTNNKQAHTQTMSGNISRIYVRTYTHTHVVCGYIVYSFVHALVVVVVVVRADDEAMKTR